MLEVPCSILYNPCVNPAVSYTVTHYEAPARVLGWCDWYLWEWEKELEAPFKGKTTLKSFHPNESRDKNGASSIPRKDASIQMGLIILGCFISLWDG